jgi:hypothetical protein
MNTSDEIQEIIPLTRSVMSFKLLASSVDCSSRQKDVSSEIQNNLRIDSFGGVVAVADATDASSNSGAKLERKPHPFSIKAEPVVRAKWSVPAKPDSR